MANVVGVTRARFIFHIMRLIRFIVNLFRFNRTNWRALALCLLAAFVFWIFNAFNKTYSTNIRFPLQFEYDQQRYAPIDHLPTSINLNVTGNGWDLFRKHFGIKLPELIITLERPTEIKKIVASTLPPILASQISTLQINFVVTDTLQIKIDERDEHDFKIVPDLSALRFEKGMGRVSTIQLSPDTILLEGPKRLLHAMADSIVVKIPAQKVKGNFRSEIEILPGQSDFLERNPPLVEVSFTVGPVTTITKSLPIVQQRAGNKPVDSLSVIFEVPKDLQQDFSKLTTMVAYKKRNDSWGITGLPEYARVVRADTIQTLR